MFGFHISACTLAKEYFVCHYILNSRAAAKDPFLVLNQNIS